MIYDLDGMLPERAFQRDARGQIKPQGGGTGSAPANQNVTTTSIPEYIRPYVEKSVGQAAALTDISQNPYQPYGGQRTAAFTPLQAQAMQNVSGMQTAGQITDASNLAYSAGQQGLAAQQNAMGLQDTALGYGQAGAGYGAAASQYGAQGAAAAQQAALQAQQGAQQYGAQGAQFGAEAAGLSQQAQNYGAQGFGFGAQGAAQAAQAQRAAEAQADQYGQLGVKYGTQGVDIGQRGVSAAEQGFGAGDAYRQQATSADAMGQYMSPYMQNVVAQQQKDAIRQADIARQGNQAAAVRSGAFGGSRAAVMEAESQRGLQDRLAMIQATGSQQAYDKAQQAQQFGANLGLQGLQAGYQGLQTGMQGTGQGMQGAGLGLQGTGQRLQAAQVGLQGTGQGMQGAQSGMQGIGQAGQMYGLGIQGAQTGLQGVGQQIAAGQLGLQGAETGIRGQQAGMQGAQTGLQGVQAATGAGQYGLAGLGAATQAAGTLGQLGQTQFGQEAAITDAQMRAGQLQQAEEQKGLDIQYQQYMDSLNYPYKQLGFMSDMYRGLPLTQGAQSMYQATPPAAQQLMGLGLGAAGLQKAFS
jgi:hypothetical protein